ncbi:hypothetical protein [Lyngbya aestuarii]|uniref:hypothetical protein n=1 Tax=Lyngbya aestuarii TaxID=118322 RepID=UPI00403DE2D6
MNSKGTIEPNYDALEELFEAVVSKLAGDKTQLAVWLIQNNIDFSLIEPQLIGSQSPFPGSNSILAGSSLLIKLKLSNMEKVIQLLAANGRLTFEVLHLEIESNGSVQFAAYDHFSHVFFGDDISLKMLENLKSREIIYDYQKS